MEAGPDRSLPPFPSPRKERLVPMPRPRSPDDGAPDPPPGGGSSQDNKTIDSRDVPDEIAPEPQR